MTEIDWNHRLLGGVLLGNLGTVKESLKNGADVNYRERGNVSMGCIQKYVVTHIARM